MGRYGADMGQTWGGMGLMWGSVVGQLGGGCGADVGQGYGVVWG